MPYITEKTTFDCPFLDNRCKLLPCQKEMILHYSLVEGYSQNKLAAKFSVSKRTISFILNPEKLAENKLRRLERGGSKIYYDREQHNVAMAEHRKRKYNILRDTIAK
jgi:transposase